MVSESNQSLAKEDLEDFEPPRTTKNEKLQQGSSCEFRVAPLLEIHHFDVS